MFFLFWKSVKIFVHSSLISLSLFRKKITSESFYDLPKSVFSRHFSNTKDDLLSFMLERLSLTFETKYGDTKIWRSREDNPEKKLPVHYQLTVNDHLFRHFGETETEVWQENATLHSFWVPNTDTNKIQIKMQIHIHIQIESEGGSFQKQTYILMWHSSEGPIKKSQRCGHHLSESFLPTGLGYLKSIKLFVFGL